MTVVLLSQSRRRHAAALGGALLAALALGLAVPDPAGAWRFTFRKGTNTNSTLTFLWTDPGSGFVQSASWRAGSGSSTDACWKGHGWLPNGRYDLWGHWDSYGGSAVKGRVWSLSDRPCANGTWRTELMIHTEETEWHGQACEPFCWEGWWDYYSAGCIKVAYPHDVGVVNSRYHAYGWNRHGAYTAHDALSVYQ